MKINMKLAVAMAALIIAYGLSVQVFAQTPPRVGGYREISKTDPDAAAAARFAITAQSARTRMTYELLELSKAERQTVAGANYRLCMQVNADGDEAFYVQAVVYVDLKRKYKLTSWEDSDCGEAAAEAAKPARPTVMVGGYRALEPNDAGATAAAEFAVGEQSKKAGVKLEAGEIERAEGQVVQGMNYRLCMRVQAQGDEPFSVLAVVYVDLKKNYRLTSWTEIDCGGNDNKD